MFHQACGRGMGGKIMTPFIAQERLGSTWKNNTNLRDLIAATGLVILLKLDSNHRFFSLCDLEI